MSNSDSFIDKVLGPLRNKYQKDAEQNSQSGTESQTSKQTPEQHVDDINEKSKQLDSKLEQIQDLASKKIDEKQKNEQKDIAAQAAVASPKKKPKPQKIITEN